jgi:hypothetical protein
MTVKAVDAKKKMVTAGPDAKGKSLGYLGTACTLGAGATATGGVMDKTGKPLTVGQTVTCKTGTTTTIPMKIKAVDAKKKMVTAGPDAKGKSLGYLGTACSPGAGAAATGGVMDKTGKPLTVGQSVTCKTGTTTTIAMKVTAVDAKKKMVTAGPDAKGKSLGYLGTACSPATGAAAAGGVVDKAGKPIAVKSHVTCKTSTVSTPVMAVTAVDAKTKKITAGPDAKGNPGSYLGTACVVTTAPLPAAGVLDSAKKPISKGLRVTCISGGKKTPVMSVTAVDAKTKKITAGPDAKGKPGSYAGNACTITTLPLPKPGKATTQKGAPAGKPKKGGSYTRKLRGGSIQEIEFERPVTPREVLAAAKRIAPAKVEGLVPPQIQGQGQGQSFGQAPSYMTTSSGFDFRRIKEPAPGQPPVPVQLVTQEEIEDSNGEVNPNQAKCGYIDTRTGTPYCEANIFANGNTKLFRYWDTSALDVIAAQEARRAGRQPPPSLSMQTLQRLSQGLAIKEIAEGPNGYIQLGINIEEIIQSLEKSLNYMQEDQKSYEISIPKIRNPSEKERIQLALDNVNKMIPYVVAALSSAQQQKTAGDAAVNAVAALEKIKPRPMGQMGTPKMGTPKKGKATMGAVSALQKMGKGTPKAGLRKQKGGTRKR